MLHATDLADWRNAPQERSPAYLRTYSAISRTIQAELRFLVEQWLKSNPDILVSYTATYPLLVYCATMPYAPRSVRILTYDIQDTDAVRKALASAAFHMKQRLAALDTTGLTRGQKERYLSYQSSLIVAHVAINRRPLYRLLNAETLIVNAIVTFAVQEIERRGLVAAADALRRLVNAQLSRLSDHFDFSHYTEHLLLEATKALLLSIASLPPGPQQRTA